MSSMNKVELIGRLGKDPEIRSMQSGDRVANLSIATSEKWKDKNTGEKNERTEWHRVVVFNQGFMNFIEGYIRKGALLFVEGQLETRKWTDSNGVEKYSTEVVLRPYNSKLILLSKAGEGNNSDQGSQATTYTPDGGVQNEPIQDVTEDEIPF